jgi:uroporphyrinogen decarboxylase
VTVRSSAWRVGEALAGRAADRVPFFLPVTVLGARLLGLSIRAYLADPARIVQGQLAWRARLGHDAVTGFHSAAAEAEPFGGEVVYHDDGPPNGGQPPLRADAAALLRLQPPRPEDGPALRVALEATRGLAAALAGEAPVVGAAVGPFSLPALQLGLPAWLLLLHERPDAAAHLARVNAAYCAAWANAQLRAGASAIALAEPLASPQLVEAARWRAIGAPAARAALAAIDGPVAFGFGSAPALGAAGEVLELGPAGLGAGAGDDLASLKVRCRGRALLLGGLDALSLAADGPEAAQRAVRAALRAAGPGGGFLLTEHHGEIPWATPDETLLAAAEAARRWGAYRPGGALDG